MENNFVMEKSASGRTTYYQSNTGNINIDNTSGYRWHYTDPITLERFLEMIHFARLADSSLFINNY